MLRVASGDVLRVYSITVGCAPAGAARPWAAALWHGFGANTYSWQMKVLDELARALGEGALVVAHDCPGFGLTERCSHVNSNVKIINKYLHKPSASLATSSKK